MKELYPLFGIVTVLNTPFAKDDTVDLTALRCNVEFAIKAGVAGFLVPAMASEVYKLTRVERREMMNAVLDQVNGRVPVFGGAGERDRGQRLLVVQDLLDVGCRNVLLQIPFSDSDQFTRDISGIAERDLDIIMLQDWDTNGFGLPVPLILQLFQEIDAFRCLKIEVVPAGVKYSEVLRATGGRLNVSGGWAVLQMMEGLERGVHAFMPTGMHEIYTTINRLYNDGSKREAQQLYEDILPVLAFANQHLDISIHFFKRLLWRQGVYPTPNVREPILPFDEHHERIADLLIERVLQLTASLNKAESHND